MLALTSQSRRPTWVSPRVRKAAAARMRGRPSRLRSRWTTLGGWQPGPRDSIISQSWAVRRWLLHHQLAQYRLARHLPVAKRRVVGDLGVRAARHPVSYTHLTLP